MPDRSARHSAPARLGRRAAAVITAAALAGSVVALGSAPAWAAPAISVTYADGAPAADPDYATSVTIAGSDFQSIQGGFGGIYVLFGWVDDPDGGTWKPSAGGVVGADYRYVPDQESKENDGFQRFVSFPGSETESTANAVMGADGSWSVDAVVPGAVFESRDRDDAVTEVDCRTETCGFITIGAHGVKNARNESFTPVAFAGIGTTAAGTAGAVGAVPAAKAKVSSTSSSAVAGNALSFTGQGFAPGEQVVAQLDDGAAAVGPLTAGPAGDVAGVLPLPVDLRAGTHALTLMGAASGQKAQREVTVKAAPSVTATEPVASDVPAWLYLVLGLFILVALTLVVTSVVTSLVRRRRSRRNASIAEAAA